MLFDTGIIAENLMGRLGSISAHMFIKNGFGVSAFFFVLIFFVAGFRMLFGFGILPAFKTLGFSLFSILWLSVFFGTFFRSGPMSLLGGVFGFEASAWLSGILGLYGTVLLIFMSLAVLLILVFDPNTALIGQWVAGLFARKPKPSHASEDNKGSFEENVFNPSGSFQDNVPLSELLPMQIIVGSTDTKLRAEPSDNTSDDDNFTFTAGAPEVVSEKICLLYTSPSPRD